MRAFAVVITVLAAIIAPSCGVLPGMEQPGIRITFRNGDLVSNGPTGYHCNFVADVENQTDYRLNGATLSKDGRAWLRVPETPANATISDFFSWNPSVPQDERSCQEAAHALQAQLAATTVAMCSMEGKNEGECQRLVRVNDNFNLEGLAQFDETQAAEVQQQFARMEAERQRNLTQNSCYQLELQRPLVFSCMGYGWGQADPGDIVRVRVQGGNVDQNGVYQSYRFFFPGAEQGAYRNTAVGAQESRPPNAQYVNCSFVEFSRAELDSMHPQSTQC